MKRHTIHYQLRQVEAAGWLDFARDLRKLLREYWHMRRALQKIKKECRERYILHVSSAIDGLEKKVRL